ncbi:GNAT family N-acetyltransferase [Halobacillus shinanisalinarum]|uniref:GNAT family N-acetyltransferase n=1 Tax=Halobacillus shinanisalinarum TaxID=2932258 RepID=A0ABY4GYT7_9BACI|nr:GNAT family N-acetyltransferase [Halobacillus shinanisalinarum]UOQ92567.1 GNAT family N-acetyltransferase [Halobacillus shinanisalinarum]
MSDFVIRTFQENDFDVIKSLLEQEGWDNLAGHSQETIQALLNSDLALVALDGNDVIGYLRGLTDGAITLYICEVLVMENYRKLGIGQQLINLAHECYPSTRIEMLATSTSQEYYVNRGFRPFYGLRKSAEESV